MPSFAESPLAVDALVVGAGFGGIYQLKKLLDLGLQTTLIDFADDVGGTWFWNRYPGAMSDTESYLYRYSWDPEDLQQYPWTQHYVYQQDVLDYLRHVVERHDLRKYMVFQTALIGARWDDESRCWFVQTSTGTSYRARYLVSSLGLLSKQNFPDIPGIESYRGEKYHTGAWPEGVKFGGKRVGIIGNGSTGVQIITEIAKDVESLVSFQRNPQYSVPSGQGPVTPEYRKYINENYMELWEQAKNRSMFAFGLEETSRQTFSVDETERKQIYEKAWSRGGGFRFMFETFGDIVTNEAANKEAADFIKEKILQTVKDPEKARKLLPTQMYARRPLCDAGYYEQFNRENVEVVSLHDTPIDSITPAGILTADGKEHNFDMIIFATGFDAVDGNYTRIAIEGRHGSLKTHWEANGPTSYLGMSVPGFPNMFMITGPNGPFCNLPPAIETQVEFISDTIRQLEERPSSVIEATVEAEREWMAECDRLSVDSLFRKTDSWIFGANVPGKKHAVLFYFAGLAPYRKVLRDVVENGWRGYTIA